MCSPTYASTSTALTIASAASSYETKSETFALPLMARVDIATGLALFFPTLFMYPGHQMMKGALVSSSVAMQGACACGHREGSEG